MIVLHILGADFALSRYIAARLADRGVVALFVKLPYYGERRPREADRRFLSVDIERSMLSMRQGVCDVRRAAAWLASRPEVDPKKLGVTGVSLGGIVSSVAAAVDPTINRGAFLLAGGDLASILWEMTEGAKYRELWVKSGRTFADLKAMTDPFDPLTYAPRLVGKRVMMIAGNVDEVIPPASARALWEAAGRPPITWYDCGHYSAVGYLLPRSGRPSSSSPPTCRVDGPGRSRIGPAPADGAVAGNGSSGYSPRVEHKDVRTRKGGVRMAAQVTSVFMYVNNVEKSLEFYNEIVGAEVAQIHAESEGAPISLAILRIGDFTIMLHPQAPHAEEFADTRVGVGIHLQLRVDDVDAFYQHCLDEGAIAQRLRRADRPELGLARVRPEGPRRLRLVGLPGQVGRSVDLTARPAAARGRGTGSDFVVSRK